MRDKNRPTTKPNTRPKFSSPTSQPSKPNPLPFFSPSAATHTHTLIQFADLTPSLSLGLHGRVPPSRRRAPLCHPHHHPRFSLSFGPPVISAAISRCPTFYLCRIRRPPQLKLATVDPPLSLESPATARRSGDATSDSLDSGSSSFRSHHHRRRPPPNSPAVQPLTTISAPTISLKPFSLARSSLLTETGQQTPRRGWSQRRVCRRHAITGELPGPPTSALDTHTHTHGLSTKI
ncbi:uncharacterized protein LOC131023396 [Salvia miltiorrhiza]|uniref:uncharacterized protein LOC131023396 n=1 Tax=Salvia miltiorrhiza TaxID=226208 RepID=UPI0025AD2606|nr:uncharacterized protein LOC131023396 [Salvia miltiorrhiza]